MNRCSTVPVGNCFLLIVEISLFPERVAHETKMCAMKLARRNDIGLSMLKLIDWMHLGTRYGIHMFDGAFRRDQLWLSVEIVEKGFPRFQFRFIDRDFHSSMVFLARTEESHQNTLNSSTTDRRNNGQCSCWNEKEKKRKGKLSSWCHSCKPFLSC